MTHELSDVAQDYLKQIYRLEQGEGRATTNRLAGAMGVAPSSATSMVKKLDALGLVSYEPYRGVRLTPAGERAALVVIRHHRLLEQYLAETLGLPLDALHAEADRLEHALSEELEARIEERLGYPTHDPHGHPIPNADLELAAVESMALSELARGERVTVLRVPDDDPELLRYLSDLSLVPGRRVELRDLAPFDGPVSVGTEAGDHSISRELAARIEVAQP